jgi:hypothetical protein
MQWRQRGFPLPASNRSARLVKMLGRALAT